MDRTQIQDEELNAAFRETQKHMADVLNRKGTGSFASNHETLGVLLDEFGELQDAISDKEPMTQIRHELLDLAVTCIFGVACIDVEGVDW